LFVRNVKLFCAKEPNIAILRQPHFFVKLIYWHIYKLLHVGISNCINMKCVMVPILFVYKGYSVPSLNAQSICQRLGNISLIRSEEHTSELQSRENLVCRLLLEKNKSTHAR